MNVKVIDPVDRVNATAFTMPTPTPESDGTLCWDSTTIVVCEASAGDVTGIGYSYTAAPAAQLINGWLADAVIGTDVMATGATWSSMVDAVRNLGRPGMASSAISAVDIALWDLKGRLLDVSVADLLGRAHDRVPVYGSGGFTSFDDDQLRRPAEWMGRAGPAGSEDEGGSPSRRRPTTGGGGPRRHR